MPAIPLHKSKYSIYLIHQSITVTKTFTSVCKSNTPGHTHGTQVLLTYSRGLVRSEREKEAAVPAHRGV